MAQSPAQEMGTPAALRLWIFGRVDRVTKRTTQNGDTYRTLIKAPAPDQYTPGGTFEVRSRKRIGAEGQEVRIEVELIGYARSYDSKAGETVRTAEHVLQAL